MTVSAEFPSEASKEKWRLYKNETRNIIKKDVKRCYSEGSGFFRFSMVSTRVVLTYAEILEHIKREIERLEKEEYIEH